MLFRLIHHIIYLKLITTIICDPIKVLDQGILPLERHSIAIQFFLDVENIEKTESCYLHAESSKCCLLDDDEYCDTIKLIGKHDDLLRPKDRRTFIFFFVTLFQLNYEGYCVVDLSHRCGLKISSKSETIIIPFNTQLLRKETKYLLKNYKRQKAMKCKSNDEDPLNECQPVDCNIKYAGAKPFYNKQIKKCMNAAECNANPLKILPDIVYDPVSNTCKDLDHCLSIVDIYAINSGLGTTIKQDIVDDRDDVTLVVYKANCPTISQNALLLKDLLSGKFSSVKGHVVDFRRSCNDALISIFSCILGISSVIILCICCINASFLVHKEWKSGALHKKAENFKSKIKNNTVTEARHVTENKEVSSKLLKEVIVSDLPLDLRDSVVDICERIGKEVRWKRRYRMVDDGSDINLKPVNESSDTSTTSDLDYSEKESILN